MLYVIIGLGIGILAGLKLNLGYDPTYAVYISLSILAIINAITDMASSNLKKEINIIRSGILLAADLVFALLLGFIGEQLGLPIYLAAVFAFGNNIYKNIRIIIDFVIEKYKK